MATYNGTSGNDTIIGTAVDDIINAFDGMNMIQAGAGNNRVTSGSGDDTISAGSGNDVINAGNGNNTIDAGDGRNTIDSGNGADLITSGIGDDVINAGDGDNRVYAGAGANIVTTGKGNDVIVTGIGNDTIRAGEGVNIIDAGGGLNWISAGAGADQITTGSGADTIFAGNGANVVNAGDGNNVIESGSGDDRITAGAGNDSIDAGQGNNIIAAGDGRNAIVSGAGADTITTGSGDDTILAGDGNNIVSAGDGDNIVTTCDGADQVKTGSGDDLISTDGGADVVDAGGGSDVVFLGSGDDTIRHDVTANAGSCDIYWGGADTDTLQLVLTAAQATNAGVLADIARFNATGGGNLLGYFKFNSFNLTTWNIERLVLVAPVDAIDDVATVGEDAMVVINVLANDKDIGAANNSALRVTGFDASALPGALTLNPNGTFTYVPGAAFQSLAAGQTAVRSFTYTIGDDQGFSDTATVQVTITGANDAPTFALAPATGTVLEGGPVATGGSIAFTDVDATDTHSVSFAPKASGYLGTFTATKSADSTGGATGQVAWSFTVSPAAIAYLNAGQTLTQTYQVKVDDGQGGSAVKDVVVTIVGTNGPPVAIADVAATSENAAIAIAVLGNDTDPDNDALTVVSASGPVGKGVVTTNGTTVGFNPGADFDHLAVGASEIVTLTYTISDGHGANATATIKVTVTGTNDAPVARVDAGATTENQAVTIDVLANDSDPDDNAVLTLTAVVAPAGKGAASIVGNKLVFTPGADFDHLKAGATEQVVVTYTVRDENGATASSSATITVTGTNDAPVAQADTASTTENQAVTIDVLANDVDVDDGHVFTLTAVAAPAGKGSVSIVGNALVFTPGADFDHLKAGATEQVVVGYTMRDENGATASSVAIVTVVGTNDAPVATSPAAAAAGAVVETGVAPGVPAASGALTSTDLDDGATATWSGSANGVYGAFAIAAGGGWTYTLDDARAATDALAAGETRTDAFTATVTDDAGATATQIVTITVTGANDAPVVTSTTAAATRAVVEAGVNPGDMPSPGQPVASGVLTSSDVDHFATATWSGSADGVYGAFAIAADGGYTYTLDNTRAATQALARGEAQTETFVATVTDDKGATATQTVTINVVGENDAPVATPDAYQVGESGAIIRWVGQNDSDVDHGALLTYALTGAPVAGLSISPGGGLSFSTNGAYESLAQGETLDVVATYIATDEFGASSQSTATITVIGENDAPVVSGAVSGAATEDGAAVTLDALANASDVDHGATLSVVLGGALPAGVSYDAATHSFTLDPANAAFQSLAAGQPTTVTYTYGVSDGVAATPTPASVTWTVTGTNDAPVVTGAQSANTVEDAAPVSLDAFANASDVDAGTTLQVTGLGALPAGVTYDAATHLFTLDPGAAAYQSLAQGQTTTVTVNYGVSDGVAAPVDTSVSWTITGVNDAPVASPVDGKVAGGSAKINLMLVLDLSGSMDQPITGGTRLTAAKTALNNLITQYDAKGDVAVRLVGFGDLSVDVAGRWLTASEARAEIAAFIADGSTDYDTAVLRAREAFLSGDGRIADGQNVSYFLSDGEPNRGTNLPGTPTTTQATAAWGLNTAEEAIWVNFLNANKINSYALGIGSDLTTAALKYLDPVAYNGALGVNTGGQLVTDVNQLGAVLAATANAPVTGNLLTSASPAGSFGPDDGGYVQQIAIAGTLYTLDYATNTVTRTGAARAFTYDQATHVLATTDQNGGALTIDLLTGDYSFTVPANIPLGRGSTVGFTLADFYGATASSALSLANDGVRDDTIITNSVGTVTIQTSALLANDIDQSGAAISVTGVQQGVGGTATLSGSTVTFAINPGINPGSFSYTGTSSTGSDVARVTIDHSQAGSATLQGTAGDDIVILATGNAPALIVGGDGADRLFGAAGADIYAFDTSDGVDTIVDTSLGNVVRVTGTGDLGVFEVRIAPAVGATTATDLLFSIGDTVVRATGANTQAIIGQVQFDAGASVYGAALAPVYALSATAGVGQIFRPTVATESVTTVTTTTGTAFADILYGGGGIDALNGGAGNDLLIGGDASDRLTGGAGGDTFAFLSATDGNTTSGLTVTQAYDIILDFSRAEGDRISLMAIDADTSLAGDQAFAFVAAPTTAVVAHSVTWSVVDANTVTIRADVDGDTIADLVIQVNANGAAYTPLAADFLL